MKKEGPVPYLHLGQDHMVESRRVIGVFDLDTATISIKTREFLKTAETRKQVVYTSSELPKSFVLAGDSEYTVFISQLNSITLKKRQDFPEFI